VAAGAWAWPVTPRDQCDVITVADGDSGASHEGGDVTACDVDSHVTYLDVSHATDEAARTH